MDRLFVRALILAALGTLATAQDQRPLVQLIKDSFAQAGPERVAEFLAAARARGLVRTDDEVEYAKDVFRAAKDPNAAAAGYAVQILPAITGGSGGSGGGPVPMGGAADTESNDTVGFAVPLDLSSGSCTVSGVADGTVNDERDV